MRLTAPEPTMRAQWEDYCLEFEKYGSSLHGTGSLAGWQWQGDEIVKKEGHIDEVTFFYMDDDDRIVGTVNIRLGLNAYLFQEIGHIGYSIRPTERNRGYGTSLLMEALHFCRFIGFDRALVICRKDNPASARVIEKCGGELEDEVQSTRGDGICMRYWIKW